MELIHGLSILIEGVVAMLGLKLLSEKKIYGLGIFVTFGIYVFYDLAKYFSFKMSSDFLYIIFFVASVSAFLTVWKLVKIK